MLRSRNCCLDLDTHRYYWDPDGARIPMRVSVTGVTNHGKDPNRFKGFESSAHAEHTRIAQWRPWPKARKPDRSALKGLTAKPGSISSSTARSPRA